MSRSLLTRASVVVATLALAATACGSNDKKDSTAATPSASAATSPTETAAAALRAGLTGLLRQHVDLTAFAVQDLVAKGSLDDARVKGSLGALEDNTNAISFYAGQGGRDLAEGVEVFDNKALRKVAFVWN